jgi:hypothetical protein
MAKKSTVARTVIRAGRKVKRLLNPDGEPTKVAVKAAKLDPLTDLLVHTAAPAAGSYALNRLVTRIVTNILLAKIKSNLVKHTPPITSAATGVGLYFLTSKVKRLQRYHEPVIIGSVIALLQSVIQTWVPQLWWLVGLGPPLKQLSYLPAEATKPAPAGPNDEYAELEAEATAQAQASSGGGYSTDAGQAASSRSAPSGPANEEEGGEFADIDTGNGIFDGGIGTN